MYVYILLYIYIYVYVYTHMCIYIHVCLIEWLTRLTYTYVRFVCVDVEAIVSHADLSVAGFTVGSPMRSLADAVGGGG